MCMQSAIPVLVCCVFLLFFFFKVIAHLIGLELTADPKMTLKEATGNALAR